MSTTKPKHLEIPMDAPSVEVSGPCAWCGIETHEQILVEKARIKGGWHKPALTRLCCSTCKKRIQENIRQDHSLTD